jgi:hypothetical protein
MCKHRSVFIDTEGGKIYRMGRRSRQERHIHVAGVGIKFAEHAQFYGAAFEHGTDPTLSELVNFSPFTWGSSFVAIPQLQDRMIFTPLV